MVRMLAGLWGEGKAPIPLELVPLAEGQVIDAGEFTIGCFPVRHRETDSFGFAFKSPSRRHLRPNRLEVLGVPDGPLRGELAQGKQEADVEDYYRKAAQADAKSYEVQFRLARFYASDAQKKYELAEKHAQQAIALDPGRIGIYKVIAAIRAEQERWQDLDVILAESELRIPDDLSAYFQAGLQTLVDGKDPVRAERYLRKYLSQEPEAYAPRLSRAHWRIGQALEKQGRKSEAIAEIESALRMEPDLEEAKKDLKRLKQ